MFRKTEAIVNLQAIRANLALADELAPHSRNIAVVKSNAYGHGLVPVARTLEANAPALAVATIDEALELRAAGIGKPILVLEGATSSDGFEAAAAHRLTVVIHCFEQMARLGEARRKESLDVWLKVDTGMHRLGIEPAALQQSVQQLNDDRLRVVAVCTHLAGADVPNGESVGRQLNVFRQYTKGLRLPLSIANSSGILAWPESHADWNRPGYMLYGNSPLSHASAGGDRLQRAMTLRTELIALHDVARGETVGYGGNWAATRPSRIGTLAIGYGDGYPRHAPNGTPTIVNGKVAPIVGRVSMDMITIDLTDHADVSVGDAAELWGEQISVNDVAAACDTIGYELLAQVSARVPRSYR